MSSSVDSVVLEDLSKRIVAISRSVSREKGLLVECHARELESNITSMRWLPAGTSESSPAMLLRISLLRHVPSLQKRTLGPEEDGSHCFYVNQCD